MLRKFIKLLIVGTIFASRAYCSASSTLIDENFVIVSDSKRNVASLFPPQFTVQKIKDFYAHQETKIFNDTLTVDTDFHKTKPYWFQYKTGTYEAFASYISFVGIVKIEKDCVIGTYHFESPYSVLFNAKFKVSLKGNSFITYNLKDSVLGLKDFTCPQGELPSEYISSASFFYIGITDESFIRETTEIQRLNGNVKTWLLMLSQLKDDNVYHLTKDERLLKADDLFSAYLGAYGYIRDDKGLLTIDEYVDISKDLGAKILACHGLLIEDIPPIETINREEVSENQAYFAVVKADVEKAFIE